MCVPIHNYTLYLHTPLDFVSPYIPRLCVFIHHCTVCLHTPLDCTVMSAGRSHLAFTPLDFLSSYTTRLCVSYTTWLHTHVGRSQTPFASRALHFLSSYPFYLHTPLDFVSPYTTWLHTRTHVGIGTDTSRLEHYTFYLHTLFTPLDFLSSYTTRLCVSIHNLTAHSNSCW